MYFNPNEIETKDLHQLLLGIVAPRPIAFVSTVDEEGIYNLASLASIEELPTEGDIAEFISRNDIQKIISHPDASTLLQNYAHHALAGDFKKDAFIAMTLSIRP